MQTKQNFTKAETQGVQSAEKQHSTEQAGYLLSAKDAAEYRAYKKQKKVAEIMEAISRSEGVISNGEEIQRVCERALRLKQAAIKMTPSWLPQATEGLSPQVKIDCIVGGNGETLTKVKVYEGRQASKWGAKELTLVLAPSMVSACRYTEIRREIKRIRKTAKKICLKVYAGGKTPTATLARLARICSETEVDFFSIPHTLGCEKLRFELSGRCRLEITEVTTLAEYQKLMSAGVERIVTSRIWEIYSEWLKEAEKEAAASVTEVPNIKTLPAATETENKKDGVLALPNPSTAVTALVVAEKKRVDEQPTKAEEKELKFL